MGSPNRDEDERIKVREPSIGLRRIYLKWTKFHSFAENLLGLADCADKKI